MNTDAQHLIIYILGIDSMIMIIGLFLSVYFTNYDSNIILSLINCVITPISILGGFLGSKKLSENEIKMQTEEIMTHEILEDEKQ